MKSMLTDENFLEKEDMYILERIKEFAATVDREITPPIPAARQLADLVDRAVSSLHYVRQALELTRLAKWHRCHDQTDANGARIHTRTSHSQVYKAIEIGRYRST